MVTWEELDKLLDAVAGGTVDTPYASLEIRKAIMASYNTGVDHGYSEGIREGL